VTYLLDTDRLIDSLKGRAAAVSLFAKLAGDALAMSLMTYGEIYDGIYRSNDPLGQETAFLRLLGWIPVLGLDEDVMRQFGQIRGTLRLAGHPIGDADILIAATAIHHDLTFVTRNLRHYERIPISSCTRPPRRHPEQPVRARATSSPRRAQAASPTILVSRIE
jgi:predicted nucleic acid-binding protein